MKQKSNIQMLVEGVKHIAKNHGFEADTNYKEEGVMCIFGGCNVPTLSDVQMLCEDVKLPKECIDANDYGIDIFVDRGWFEAFGKDPYKGGQELWRRRA